MKRVMYIMSVVLAGILIFAGCAMTEDAETTAGYGGCHVAITYIYNGSEYQPAPLTEGEHKDPDMNVVTPLCAMYRFVVFWGHTGNRVHIQPDCPSFVNGVLFGTLDVARSVGRYEWCRRCSPDWRTHDDGFAGDDRFLRYGNPNIE